MAQYRFNGAVKMVEHDYICIPRDIVERRWYKCDYAVRMYVHILLASAGGVMVASCKELADELQISSKSAATAMRILIRAGDVVRTTKNGKSVLSINFLEG